MRPASRSAPKRARNASTIAAFSSTAARAQRRADDLRAFAEELHDVDLGGALAAHRADDHDAAVDRERLEIAREIARADVIEDHVRAARLLDEVFVAIVDRHVRAVREAARALLRASRR